jgi:hypothetical protein
MERVGAALRHWLFVAISLLSVLGTLGIVSGLAYASRFWLATRSRITGDSG